MYLNKQQINYRAEFDGLRAIAVISVVIFHFFPDFLSFGYLGVDIFFVLSGFLITQQLTRYSKHETFKLRDFYSRRINRLMPAVFVCLLVVTAITKFMFLDVDFDSFKESLLASYLFFANVYFWLDGGYFGGQDKLKPLLHMWSLSVEEQFYIFYPIFLLLFFGVSRSNYKIATFCISAVSCVSLGLYFYLTNIGGSTPAFFFLPTRIWQFGAGAIAFLLIDSRAIYLSKGNLSLQALSFSLLLICLAGAFDNVLGTLIVTLSCTLLLLSVGHKSIIDAFLTLSVMRRVGQISYSLYLYHWPIAVFVNYYFTSNIPIIMSLICVCLSVFCAEISYRYVESPFRFAQGLSKTMSLCILSAITTLIITLLPSMHTISSNADELAEAKGSHFRCSSTDYILFGASRACPLGLYDKSFDVALVGNSHAQMYAPILDEILTRKEISGVLVPLNGCLPTLNVNKNEACSKQAQANYKSIVDSTYVSQVVLALTWYDSVYWMKGSSKKIGTLEDLELDVVNLISELEKRGKSVILIGPIPLPSIDIASELSRDVKFKRVAELEIGNFLKQPSRKYKDQFEGLNVRMAKYLGPNYINPSVDLCDASYCYFGDKTRVFFADSNHLSKFGRSALKETKNSLFERLIGKR